jgi:hypothetical protein
MNAVALATPVALTEAQAGLWFAQRLAIAAFREAQCERLRLCRRLVGGGRERRHVQRAVDPYGMGRVECRVVGSQALGIPQPRLGLGQCHR